MGVSLTCINYTVSMYELKFVLIMDNTEQKHDFLCHYYTTFKDYWMGSSVLQIIWCRWMKVVHIERITVTHSCLSFQKYFNACNWIRASMSYSFIQSAKNSAPRIGSTISATTVQAPRSVLGIDTITSSIRNVSGLRVFAKWYVPTA